MFNALLQKIIFLLEAIDVLYIWAPLKTVRICKTQVPGIVKPDVRLRNKDHRKQRFCSFLALALDWPNHRYLTHDAVFILLSNCPNTIHRLVFHLSKLCVRDHIPIVAYNPMPDSSIISVSRFSFLSRNFCKACRAVRGTAVL